MAYEGELGYEHHDHAGTTGPVSSSAPSAVAVDAPKANDYNRFAEAYTAENETNLNNAYYGRPAMPALAGDVAGRRIPDAGRGSGPPFAALRDRGAVVSGFDASAGMLEPARRRPGDGADLRVADLGDPLPYADDTFGDVLKPGGQTALVSRWQQAAARDDRGFRRRRFPDHGHQRAGSRSRRPRAVSRRHRGHAALPVLPVPRPAGRLAPGYAHHHATRAPICQSVQVKGAFQAWTLRSSSTLLWPPGRPGIPRARRVLAAAGAPTGGRSARTERR